MTLIGHKRPFRAWIFTAVRSRHRFVYPTFEETTARAIEACDAAWEFLAGSSQSSFRITRRRSSRTPTRSRPGSRRTFWSTRRREAFTIDPARVRHPRDKPRAEVSVQIVQRWVLAALRHRTLFTVADLNAAIRASIDAINNRPMKTLTVSRRALFEQLDSRALTPLTHAVRADRVEAVPDEHRLTRRGRAHLLRRAVSAGPHAGRDAEHGDHR